MNTLEYDYIEVSWRIRVFSVEGFAGLSLKVSLHIASTKSLKNSYIENTIFTIFGVNSLRRTFGAQTQ